MYAKNIWGFERFLSKIRDIEKDGLLKEINLQNPVLWTSYVMFFALRQRLFTLEYYVKPIR